VYAGSVDREGMRGVTGGLLSVDDNRSLRARLVQLLLLLCWVLGASAIL